MNTTKTIISITSILALSGFIDAAEAGVKFRLSYEANSSEYVVYMTTDSVPSPDMILSSQVTVVVPHQADTPFSVTNINSAIKNVTWVDHSRVDAPTENTNNDYLSFGLFYQGATPPKFNWAANQEKRIFSFTSNNGCVSGVKLLANNDPFNQLPNSVDTNPGNEISNLGWAGGNMYTGNIGDVIQCGGTPPITESCDTDSKTVLKINNQIKALNTLVKKITQTTQRTDLQQKLQEFRSLLLCQNN